jgi:peptide/nickel transport system permease protein
MIPHWAKSGRVVAGLLLVLMVASGAALAPWLARHDPGEQDLLAVLLPPSWMRGGDPSYFLGTDSLGRDNWARLLFGARTALTVAVLSAAGAAVVGTILAHLAGYLGGAVDWLISRAVEIWMSFPPVVLSLILMVGLGGGLDKVIYAIILVDWTRFCRVLRTDVVLTTRRDYVTAARLAGYSHAQTLIREVFPATLPLIITLVSLEMGIAVVVEAILSFVGLGVGASRPAWGQMLFPMLAVFLVVAGCNLLGDGLRRTLDVRLSERGRP